MLLQDAGQSCSFPGTCTPWLSTSVLHQAVVLPEGVHLSYLRPDVENGNWQNVPLAGSQSRFSQTALLSTEPSCSSKQVDFSRFVFDATELITRQGSSQPGFDGFVPALPCPSGTRIVDSHEE